MLTLKDFKTGQKVKVVAKLEIGTVSKNKLSWYDEEVGICTGMKGVVVDHPFPPYNDNKFVYVNFGEKHPFYAMFPEQLSILDGGFEE